MRLPVLFLLNRFFLSKLELPDEDRTESLSSDSSVELFCLRFNCTCFSYIKESKLDELVDVFESYYGEAPNKVNLELFTKPANTMQYYWSNSQYLVGLGDNVYEDICYVYVTFKNRNSYFTQDEE